MANIHIALAVALCASPAAAQLPVAFTIKPSVDTTAQRAGLREFSFCLARQRSTWARRTLAKPYLSDDQARVAGYALSGRDSCVLRSDVELTFRTSSIVSNLAEYFLREDLPRVDAFRLSSALSGLKALNGSEDFALCVVSRNPVAARSLTLSEFNSTAEAEAAQALTGAVQFCTNRGETLVVDLQALRALSGIALYRGVTAVLKQQ